MDRRILDKYGLVAMPVALPPHSHSEDTVRREDAYNRDVSLGYLARQDYQNARGYAELLINEQDRAELVAHLAREMPTEHKTYEQASKTRREETLKDAKEWRETQAKKGKSQP